MDEVDWLGDESEQGMDEDGTSDRAGRGEGSGDGGTEGVRLNRRGGNGASTSAGGPGRNVASSSNPSHCADCQ